MAKTLNQKVGQLGENLAKYHLIKEGYQIIGQNYKEKWGEIDLIAQTKNLIVFVEVKTLLVKEFFNNAPHKPEDQLSFRKLDHLKKTILHYLNKNRIEKNYRLDLIAIEINPQTKKYRLRHLKGVD